MTNPSSFFLEPPHIGPDEASVHLLPVPLEATVSYGGGTSRGPQAILEASFQLELYDREFDCEPGPLLGVHTLPEMYLSDSQETALESIRERVSDVFREGVLLGILGGEHSLSFPCVKGVLERVDGPITIVQLDAHADLRDTYEGSPHSHACVARRFLELDRVEQVLQLGVRSLCTEEAELIKSEERVRTWFSEDVHRGDFQSELRRRVRGKNLYLTVDVDGFDPTLVPSTGTPEPDGLSYSEGEDILRILSEEANLVAFDCVELAPVEGHHVSEFVVAKFLYRLMTLFKRDVIGQRNSTRSA